MGKKRVYLVAGILAAIGAALFAYKLFFIGYPIWPDEQTEAWEIEVRASFNREPAGPANLRIFAPRPTSRYAVMEQRFVASGYGFTSRNVENNQQVAFTKRNASGGQVVYFRFIVKQTPSAYTPPATKADIGEHGLTGARLAAGQSLVEKARSGSADRITLTQLLLREVMAAQPAGPAAILLGNKHTRRDRVAAAVTLLSLAQAPAQMVNGLELGATRRRASLAHWLEVHIDGKWVPFDPVKMQPGVSVDHMPWWRGGGSLIQLDGGKRLKRNIAVQRLEESALANVLSMQRARSEDQQIFSLFNLPIRTQEVYKLLVVVPIAIFLLVILRNVIGVTTLGTFMPVLIALAFRETGLWWGLTLFVVVVGVGLLARAGMEGLKLLLVPRLAAVLIVVILIMAVLSLISHRLGLDSGLSVALFPMVILTMTIERLSIVWDERGADTALKQAGGSLVVATLCYLLMQVALIQYWFFAFPELLLVLLALTLLLGRYTGYRLTEIKRFKVLTGSKA